MLERRNLLDDRCEMGKPRNGARMWSRAQALGKRRHTSRPRKIVVGEETSPQWISHVLQTRRETLTNPWLTTRAGLARQSIASSRLVRWDLQQATCKCTVAEWTPAIYGARRNDQRAGRPVLAHGIIPAMNGGRDTVLSATCINLHHIKFPQFIYRLCTKVAGQLRSAL